MIHDNFLEHILMQLEDLQHEYYYGCNSATYAIELKAKIELLKELQDIYMSYLEDKMKDDSAD